MNKILFSVFLSLGIFFCGCGGTKNNSGNNDSVKVGDSVAVKNPDTLSIAQHLGGDTIETKNNSLVLFRFNAALAKHKTRLLSPAEVRATFCPFHDSTDNMIQNTFDRYLFLAQHGAKNPDIGDIIDVKIYFVDSVLLSKNLKAICWSMYFESYAACPYSQGTYYLLSTLDAKGKTIATTLLGESTSGADAPVAWSTNKSATIFTDCSFKEVERDSSWEDPDSTAKVEVNLFRGRINEDGRIMKK